MERKIIRTTTAPRAIGPYKQAVAAGDFLFVSGQIALDPATGHMIEDTDIRAQTTRVMENLGAILVAAKTGFDKVVKSTIYLVDMKDFTVVNEVYAEYFKDTEPPARATVQVAALPREARVEIDMIAMLK